MSDLSNFLFARPSFCEGIARLVDFGGFLNEYNYSETPQRADALAAWADWTTVGNDIRAAWAVHILESQQAGRSQDVEAF